MKQWNQLTILKIKFKTKQMELNLNREAIKNAIKMSLHYEQNGYFYPRHAFDFHVLKEGSYWKIQWIFTEGFKEVRGGDVGEYLEIDKTDSFKQPINEDARIEDLVLMVAESLERIYKNEYN